MSNIIKYCPNCQYETDNEQDVYCPFCKDARIELLTKTSSRISSQTIKANEVPGSLGRIVSDVLTDTSSEKKIEPNSPDISLGRANAIGGDVKIETNSTIGDITVVNEKKTLAEELIEKKRSYRAECKKYCVDGLISDAAVHKLENYRAELDLDKDIANEILSEVKSHSKRIRTELSPTGKIKLEYAASAIERNDGRAILSALVDLEGWMNRVQVDELNQMYYQLYAIVKSNKYLDLLSDQKEDYWKTFWSYVAYSILGLQSEAETSLAELTAWDSFYPGQNQCALSVVGYLMRNEENAARVAFSKLTTGFSKELSPLCNTLDELLNTDWLNVSTKLSPRSKFYAKNLFGEFYNTIESRQKEAEIIRLKKREFKEAYSDFDGDLDKACQKVGITNATLDSWLLQDSVFFNDFNNIRKILEDKRVQQHIEIEKQKAIDAENQNKKIKFIQWYKSNGCDVQESCAETGISRDVLYDWMRSDKTFADDLTLIKQKHIKEQKDAFVKCYGDNNCDILTACKETGLSPDNIREWRKQDGEFNIGLSNIEREYIKRRIREFISKVLPYILIISLLVFIIGHIINTRIEAKKTEQEKQQYNELLQQFNTALSNVNLDDRGVDAIEIVIRNLESIKVFKDSLHIPSDSQYDSLKNMTLEKCDELINHYYPKRIPEYTDKDYVEVISESNKYDMKYDKCIDILKTIKASL